MPRNLLLIYTTVYNKKKFQIFVMNIIFILSHEVKKVFSSFMASPLMKYIFFHFTWWNKSRIYDKKLNILQVFNFKIVF